MSKKNHIRLPMLPMRDTVVFPGMNCPFFIGRVQSLESLQYALQNDRRLVVVAQKNARSENPGPEDIYAVGTVGRVLQVMKMPNNTVKVLFEAEYRCRIISTNFDLPHYAAVTEVINDESSPEEARQIASLHRMIRKSLPGYFGRENRNNEIISSLEKEELNANELINRIAPLLDNIDTEKKQALLENTHTLSRLEDLYQKLIEEEENKKLETKIRQHINTQIGKTHREYYLNEQMKAIQKELGNEDGKSETSEFEEKIKTLKLTPEAKEVAERELKRLKGMSPAGNLDEDHYGLEKVKERIIEFLAVSKNIGTVKGPIICLVGPPGVGKTSLARSIGKCLNRSFVRISLGGVRDEAEIRGHRRTYIGAMPGKILQMMKKAKSSNPLILLDEVDKLGRSYMGDPAAALLEVLDPEQNNTFMDHFLEVEYDLSKVLFLCTANTAQDIPPALYDRMEIIRLSGYTEPEKVCITQKHLIPKQMEENGISAGKVRFRKEAIPYIIRHYTREAGIRSLERAVGKVCRKAVTELMKQSGDAKKNISLTQKKIREYMGVPPYNFDRSNDKNEIGVATGLAWTSFGGDILFIEVTDMKGKGTIQLTGKLGEVMKESAAAALSYIRTNANSLGIYSRIFKERDIHVHIPEGATPKDGPSAGITLVTALVSLFTSIAVRKEVAMTGEITLRGKVLPIGGLKEKLIAARRSGITEVIIPKDNLKDMEDIPEEIKSEIRIIPAEHISEVLKHALEQMPTAVDDADIKESENADSAQDKNFGDIKYPGVPASELLLSLFGGTEPYRVPIIVGPTGSGKSRLALEFAKYINGEIISADSVSVYQHLNIFSAKPSPTDRQHIPHHLIDIIAPDARYNAGEFCRDSRRLIPEIFSRQRIPVITGGTPLYIRALVHGLIDTPETPAHIKTHIQKMFADKGADYCRQELQRLDPDTAARLKPNDRQRILRALEIVLSGQSPISSLQASHRFSGHFIRPLYIMPNILRSLLYANINRRTAQMIKEGGIEETQNVLEMGYAPDCPGLQSIGYKQAVQYLRGQISLDSMTEEIAKHTRRYAKRQLTWYRQYTDILYVPPEITPDKLTEAIRTHITYLSGADKLYSIHNKPPSH
ncbi:hypothetical protein CHS0354_026785 [Potamilus streckersoni]|uniref:Lon protease homolog n=1 Tax=Potamilus streckersoni TaxID=2493646 RepID=A0AAE0W7J1_9BIVA|nr:hypothetical protein CHS0354_026785 [Potamilus streckersoni]